MKTNNEKKHLILHKITNIFCHHLSLPKTIMITQKQKIMNQPKTFDFTKNYNEHISSSFDFTKQIINNQFCFHFFKNEVQKYIEHLFYLIIKNIFIF